MRRSVATIRISRRSGAPRRECHHLRKPPTGFDVRMGALPSGVFDSVSPLISPPPRIPASSQPISGSPPLFAHSRRWSCQDSTTRPPGLFLGRRPHRADRGSRGTTEGGRRLDVPEVPSRPVDGARLRSVAAIAGRVVLGVLVAVLL